MNFFDSLIRNVTSFFLKLIGKNDEKTINNFTQFIKFAIVGVSNSIVSYAVYTISLLAFKSVNLFPEIDYLISQVIQFLLSVLWSFYWNNRFVFTVKEGEKRVIWKALLKTYASYSFTGLFLNSILLFIWVQVIHISEFIAPLINIVISMPINFLINKYWAFRTRKNNE